MARNYINRFNRVYSVFITILCFFIVSGCANFRKKFIRQKKGNKKEKFIPVLDPLTYEVQSKTVEEKYRYHYSMWKIWSRDLTTELSQEIINDKRVRYLLSQVIEHMNHMELLVVGNVKEFVVKYRTDYIGLKKDYDKPKQLRNYTVLKNRSRRLEKAVANDLKPKKLFVKKES